MISGQRDTLKNECSLLFVLIDINNVREWLFSMLSGHISQRFVQCTRILSPIGLPVQTKIASFLPKTMPCRQTS